MQRRQAFLFELMPPAGSDERLMRRFCGSRRVVFNNGLALHKERHAAGLKHLSDADLDKHLTAWKGDPVTTWLEAHAQGLQQSLKHLCRADANFFRTRADFPRFKTILDQGWGMVVRQLASKLEWRGGLLVAVDPRTTSRRGPECRHGDADTRPSQARFACVACGHEAHADHVGAINVLRAGHARLACGETSPVMASAQEPTEAGARLAA